MPRIGSTSNSLISRVIFVFCFCEESFDRMAAYIDELKGDKDDQSKTSG